MNLRACRQTLLIPVGLFLLATVAWAQDQGREFDWKGKLAADQIVASWLRTWAASSGPRR